MTEAEMLREIVDAQLEMVCRFTADGTILFANRAYTQNLGLAPESPVGRNLWDFVTGEDREDVQSQLDALHPDNVAVTIENRIETPQGPRWTLWENHALKFDEDGRWTVAQSAGIDITERKRLEERLQLLVDELNHRVKNTLMVVQALAYQSFRGHGLAEEPMTRFSDRLAALGAAHTALSKANWGNTQMSEIVRQGLIVVGNAIGRVSLSGPDAVLPAERTVSLVMVVHELATNALKYGALANDSGSIEVRWTSNEPAGTITLTWTERGGPIVKPPARPGFGSRLIADTVNRRMSGHAELAFEPGGLVCSLSFPNREQAG